MEASCCVDILHIHNITFTLLRKYRTIKVVDWRVNLSSDAPANFAGLLVVSQGICRMQMAKKAPPSVPLYCAVFP
jgi:hypothetical protein